MTATPSWLPDKLDLHPNFEKNEELLYEIFCQDIRDYTLLYMNKPIWVPRKIEDGKEEMFWHLTKEEPKRIPRRKAKFIAKQKRPKRIFDKDRSERLVWFNPIILNADNEEVLCWDHRENGGVIKTYIWLKGFSYVIILKKQSNGTRRLITAYYLVKKDSFKRMERKYENRIK